MMIDGRPLITTRKGQTMFVHRYVGPTTGQVVKCVTTRIPTKAIRGTQPCTCGRSDIKWEATNA